MVTRSLVRPPILAEVWLVDLWARTVEVSNARGAGTLVSDTIRWRVPGLDMLVPVNLHEVFAGL